MNTDESEDSAFFKKMREQVLRYLEHVGVSFHTVPQQPDWYLAPHVSVWPVFGVRSADRPGWFAIAGNLPTDYVSSDDARDARSAMHHFARLWLEAAEFMAAGKPHPGFTIGKPEDWPELHKMLRARALLLADFADDDQLWLD